jgi:hypothetical protein
MPRSADLILIRRDDRVVPQAAVSNRSKEASLFDQLVGAREQARWHVEAKRNIW